ncbi:MAG: PHP domain-containing protein [Halioglobus sp.]
MLIDFHTHTSASDGALAPEVLLARAAELGVAVLSITDHDTMGGYAAVRNHPLLRQHSMQLVPGVEFSCRWSGATIHVVGLGMEPGHNRLSEALTIMESARCERALKIARRLGERGFEGALQGAQAEAGESQLGRPHFASWMVQQEHVKDHREAFDRYLGQGKIGDVKAFWPELQQVVEWINASAGVAVLAHPYKYRFTGMKLRRLIMAFVEAGGGAIEMQSGRQTAQQTAQLKRYAQEFDLEVSVGSDFHRDGAHNAPLGVDVPLDAELRGVWQRWL